MIARRCAPSCVALAIVLVIATALALLPSPLTGEVGNATQNALHPIGFFALTLLALYATRRRPGASVTPALASGSAPALTPAPASAPVSAAPGPATRPLAVGVGAIGFALATEATQAFVPGRSASVEDLIADLLGSGAALALWGAMHARTSVATRIGALALALCSAGLALAPSLPPIVARLTRPAWPILEDGSGLFATHRAVGTYGSTTRLDPGRAGVELELGAGRWPGVRLLDMHADWRGCDSLLLTVTLEGDRALTPMLRLHDEAHDRTNTDRFRRRITLVPGHNTVRVAIDDIERMDQAAPARRMSLDRMAELVLFASPDDAGRILHLHDLRLDGCG